LDHRSYIATQKLIGPVLKPDVARNTEARSKRPSNDSRGAADQGGDAQGEQVPAVELKGDQNTEIIFEGKAKASFLGADKTWGDSVSGNLTVRKDKASGKHWLQINAEHVRSWSDFCTSIAVHIQVWQG
jgi:hypothetical protein